MVECVALSFEPRYHVSSLIAFRVEIGSDRQNVTNLVLAIIPDEPREFPKDPELDPFENRSTWANLFRNICILQFTLYSASIMIQVYQTSKRGVELLPHSLPSSFPSFSLFLSQEVKPGWLPRKPQKHLL